jgi:hypothetical protein
MNRTVVVVKMPGKRRVWGAIRIHWDEGEKVEKWLTAHPAPHGVIWAGHRSTILQPHRLPTRCPEHWEFKTLREAIAHCEHSTLAVHNGKGWKFKHEPE